MADYDKVILPGKEGKISVIIKGSRIHPGLNKKSFTVTTNDPENRKVLLFVSATIKKVFDVSKNIALAGFEGEDFEIESMMTNVLDEPIRIVGYRWDEESAELEKYRDGIDVRIEEVEKGKKHRLLLKKKGEIAPGRYLGELVLITDFEKLKEKRVNVMLNVNPIIEVNPRQIMYSGTMLVEGGENVFEKKFHIMTSKGDSLKVLKVIPSRDDIEVDIQERHPGRVYEGIVKVKPTESIIDYHASIRILTNYRGYEEIEIAVQGSFSAVPRKK